MRIGFVIPIGSIRNVKPKSGPCVVSKTLVYAIADVAFFRSDPVAGSTTLMLPRNDLALFRSDSIADSIGETQVSTC